MTNIFKLKYESKESGIADFIDKGIILSEEMLFELPPTHAVVDLLNGKFDLMIEDVIETPATFDDDGNELTPDILKVWDFGGNEIHPITPSHSFAGYETPTETTE